MAIIITAPQENSVLIDANLTEIIFTVVEFQGEYHFAKLFINDVEFDRMVIPKITYEKMILSFKNLLLKSFRFPNLSLENLQIINNDKSLRIEIWKNSLTGNSLVNTLNYKLRYSSKPTNVLYNTNQLTWIDVAPDEFLVSSKTRITLPFYCSNINNLLIKIEDNNGLIFYQVNYSTSISNTCVINFLVNVPETTSFYTVSISGVQGEIKKHFKVQRNKIYKSKKIEFYNTFGFPMCVELFGKMAIKDDLKYVNYKNGLGNYITAEVNEETNVTIDTGYLTEKERPVISQILNSLNTRIQIDNEYIDCISSTKTLTRFTDGEFVTSNNLVFEFNKKPNIKN